MNKTHEELAREATDTLQRRAREDDDLLKDREVHAIILTAITAAVRAEREQSQAVLETIRDQCAASYGTSHAIYKMAADELARLSLNGTDGEVSGEGMNELEEWLKDRPEVIKDLARKFPPMTRISVNGLNNWVISYEEDGGLSVTPFDPSEDYESAVAARVRICPHIVAELTPD